LLLWLLLLYYWFDCTVKQLTSEMMGDALDDALNEDGDAEAEDAIVGQVLDEIGITFGMYTLNHHLNYTAGVHHTCIHYSTL
jgi:hypothetical protein